eukprot:923017-Amphidinium_carterae.6
MGKLNLINEQRGDNESKLSRKLMMQMHGRKWNALSHVAKQIYEEQARQMRQDKAQRIREALCDVTGRIELEEVRTSAKECQTCDSMRASVCKFSDNELRKLARFMTSQDLSKQIVDKHRTVSNTCQLPLSEDRFNELQS